MLFDDDLTPAKTHTLQDAIDALPLDPNGLVPAEVVQGLSDLSQPEVLRFQAIWQNLDSDQRALIMGRLAETSQVDFAVDYSAVAKLGYDDPSAVVRLNAIRAAWSDESRSMLQTLLALAQSDPSDAVRDQAVSQLATFVQRAEIGSFNASLAQPAQELLYQLASTPSQPLDVRRHALEGLAHTSHPAVPDLIRQAYAHTNPTMRQSAVMAMGHTCDKTWTQTILDELNSDDEDMRLVATLAVGGVGAKQAAPVLEKLFTPASEDHQRAIIWTLAEIGGADALHILRHLENLLEAVGPSELLDDVEEALQLVTFLDDRDGLDDLLDE